MENRSIPIFLFGSINALLAEFLNDLIRFKVLCHFRNTLSETKSRSEGGAQLNMRLRLRSWKDIFLPRPINGFQHCECYVAATAHSRTDQRHSATKVRGCMHALSRGTCLGSPCRPHCPDPCPARNLLQRFSSSLLCFWMKCCFGSRPDDRQRFRASSQHIAPTIYPQPTKREMPYLPLCSQHHSHGRHGVLKGIRAPSQKIRPTIWKLFPTFQPVRSSLRPQRHGMNGV